MGIDSQFRNVLRRALPIAFYPQTPSKPADAAADGDRPCAEWPDPQDIGVVLDDVNSRIRQYGLCLTLPSGRTVLSIDGEEQEDGETTTEGRGATTWGEVLQRLAREYLAMFRPGARCVVAVLDGHTPPNKAKEQKEREKKWLSQLERKGRKPHDWSIEQNQYGDEKPWFYASDVIRFDWNDIYYGKGGKAKQKFYEFITHYLLYEMPLPRENECRIIVDCGALLGYGKLSRPVQALNRRREWSTKQQMDWGVDEYVAYRQPEATLEARFFERVIQACPEADYYGETYTEADDRLVYWVYQATLNWKTSVLVCSEDGDTTLAMMATYRTRMACNVLQLGVAAPPRAYHRRTEQPGWLLAPNGKRTKIKQPEIIDTDLLAELVDNVLRGHVAAECRTNDDLEYMEKHFDGAILYAFLTLLRKNDYSEDFKGVTAITILQKALEHPALLMRLVECNTPEFRVIQAAREWFGNDFRFNSAALEAFDSYMPVPSAAASPANSGEQFLLKYKPAFRASGLPEFCAIVNKSLYDFIRHCYQTPWLKSRMDQFPPPRTQDVVRGKAARVAWTLDKMINGGRPGYKIPWPFQTAVDTESRQLCSVYGYQEIVAKTNGRRNGTGDEDNEMYTNNVQRREKYGVMA